MAWLEDLAKGGAEGLLKPVRDIIALFKADPNIAATSAATIAKAEADLQQFQLDYDLKLSLAQTEINKIEAASSDRFTSRWRPMIGWICGVGLGTALIVGPFFTWISEWIANGKPGPFPTLNTDVLLTTLGAMLGFGGMRSFDKLQGTVREGPPRPIAPK